jgi:hypothetical protein
LSSRQFFPKKSQRKRIQLKGFPRASEAIVPIPFPQQASPETTSPEELHQLTAFSRHLNAHPQAADRVRSSGNPEEIIAIASETGFQISVETLRSKLWDLWADHWPWAGQSGGSRIQFVRQTRS